jgi:hypothetical protein
MLGFIKTTYCKNYINTKTTLHNLKVELNNNVNDINIVDWNAVLQEQHIFLSLPYLSTLEKTLPSGVLTLYVIVYDKNIPVFITYLQLYTFSKEQLNALKTDISKKNAALGYGQYIANRCIYIC